MKHTIIFKCGHTKTENLYGSRESQRVQRVLMEDVGDCPDCYAAWKQQIADDPAYGVKEMFLTDYEVDHPGPIITASFAYRHGHRKLFRDPVIACSTKGEEK